MADSEIGRLARYLPEIYADDESGFLHSLLCACDDLWLHLTRPVDQLHAYFDPQLTPDSFLLWLAGWLGLALDSNWRPQQLRQLIACSHELYARRGTLEALGAYLALYLDAPPKSWTHLSKVPLSTLP